MTDQPPETAAGRTPALDDSPVVHRSAERARAERALAGWEGSPTRRLRGGGGDGGEQRTLIEAEAEAKGEEVGETGTLRRDSFGLGIRLEGEGVEQCDPNTRASRTTGEETRRSSASSAGSPPPTPPPELPLPVPPPFAASAATTTSTSPPIRPPRSSQRLSSQTTATTRTTLSSSSTQSSPPMRRPTSSLADSHLSSSTAATSLPDLEEKPVPSTSKLLPPIVLEEAHSMSEPMSRQGSTGGYSDLSWDEDWEFPRPPVPELAALSFPESTASSRTPRPGGDRVASQKAQTGGWLDPEGMGEDEREYLGVLSSRGGPHWMSGSEGESTSLQPSTSASKATRTNVDLRRSALQASSSLHPFSASQEQHHDHPEPPSRSVARGVPAILPIPPPTSPPQPEWPSLRAGFTKSPPSRSPSSFSQPPQSPPTSRAKSKRTSVLSTLAAPLAHLGRSRSTSSSSGSRDGGGRRSRLSTLFEGGSSRSSLTRSASTREAPTASASPSTLSRSASHLSTPGSAPPTNHHVRFLASPMSASPVEVSPRSASPRPASDSLLHPPPPKAAKMLGLKSSPAASIAERYRASERGSTLPPDLGLELSRSTAGKAAEVLGLGLSGAASQPRRRVVLPDWPATRSEIRPCEIAVAQLAKVVIEPAHLCATRPSFHNRTIALTRLPGFDHSQPSTYTLHAFVSPRSIDNEISRLEILPTSIVCAPAAGEAPPQAPAYLLKVTGWGYALSGGTRGLGSDEPQDMSWIVGTNDLGEYKDWLSMMKEAVRETRSTPAPVQTSSGQAIGADYRARQGLHVPVADYASSPPTSPTYSHTRSPHPASFSVSSTSFLDAEDSDEDAAELVDFLLPLPPSQAPAVTPRPKASAPQDAQRSSIYSSRSGSSQGSSRRESERSAYRHASLPPQLPPPSAPLPPLPTRDDGNMRTRSPEA
ncbi:hypothetical protein RTBOTA2_006570 [Rhodotorula toruloides]|nr:hypothetical protein RTBOTA2_006570 [Rhodotorula toruloides]